MRGSPGPLQVVVAGTAGGVGTTTVAALLAARERDGAGLALHDHTGGSLAARLPDAGGWCPGPGRVELVDLGPHAFGPGVGRLADPRTRLVVVSAATPLGARLAAGCLLHVEAAHNTSGLARTFVALVEVCGRRAPPTSTAELAALGPASVVVLRADRALAVGGPVDHGRLSEHSRTTLDRLGGLLDLDRPVGVRGAQAAW